MIENVIPTTKHDFRSETKELQFQNLISYTQTRLKFNTRFRFKEFKDFVSVRSSATILFTFTILNKKIQFFCTINKIKY